MKTVIIDTTKKEAYIIAINDEKICVSVVGKEEKHSENLMGHLEDALKNVGLNVNDVDCYGNVSGPGSFTGIRVGLTTLKAFSVVSNKPIINVSIFDVVAPLIKGVFISQCTSTSLYYANINGVVSDYGVMDKVEIENIDETIYLLEQEQNIINQSYKTITTDEYINLLVNKIKTKYSNKEYDSNPEPFYIQLSQAERNLQKKDEKNEN